MAQSLEAAAAPSELEGAVLPVPADEALMLCYRDGDVAAFEILYLRYKGPLYRYLLRGCQNAAIAGELYQETWAALIKSRAGYEPRAQFKTYIYRLAHSKLVDHLRKSDSRQAPLEEADEVAAPMAEQPENAAAQAALGRRLQASLARLPPEQREVFLLKAEGGLTLEEIAAATEVGRETVKSRLRYALVKLREELSDVWP